MLARVRNTGRDIFISHTHTLSAGLVVSEYEKWRVGFFHLPALIRLPHSERAAVHSIRAAGRLGEGTARPATGRIEAARADWN